MVDLGWTGISVIEHCLAAIFASLCDRSLVSLRGAAFTFGFAPAGNPRTVRALERLDAPAHLAALARSAGDSRLPAGKNHLLTFHARRTANAFAQVLALIGTPARSPKSRAKSPGWTPGQPRSRRIRYPIVKKRFTKPKRTAQKSA